MAYAAKSPVTSQQLIHIGKIILQRAGCFTLGATVMVEFTRTFQLGAMQARTCSTPGKCHGLPCPRSKSCSRDRELSHRSTLPWSQLHPIGTTAILLWQLRSQCRLHPVPSEYYQCSSPAISIYGGGQGGCRGRGWDRGRGSQSNWSQVRRYYWNHGCCHHNISKCKNPAQNQQPQATFNNINIIINYLMIQGCELLGYLNCWIDFIAIMLPKVFCDVPPYFVSKEPRHLDLEGYESFTSFRSFFFMTVWIVDK